MQPNRLPAPVLLAMGTGLAYGLISEMIFLQASDLLVGTLSLSFLVLVPVAIGALTVVLGPKNLKRSWPYAVFMPWLVCLAVGILVGVLAMEAWVCIIIGMPVFFVMSSVGGALTKAIMDARRDSGTLGAWIGLAALSPMLLMPVEGQWQPRPTTREVVQVVEVDAPADRVWAQFIEVSPITAAERPFAWFRLLGLPQPVEAVLTNPGAAGMRRASYDNGMRVLEPTLVWEPAQRYRFGVMLDPTAATYSPLWAALAGDHLVVEHVEYRIEAGAGSGDSVRLTLTSRYTLRTPLNRYAGLWIDFLLSDFEHTILQVVKNRAEAGLERRE